MLTFLLSIADSSNHDKIIYLYNHFYNDLFAYAYKRFVAYNRKNYLYDTEDAVQNTFIKVCKYIHKIDFSLDEHKIKAYIFSILCNEISNIIKDEKIPINFNHDIVSEDNFDFLDKIDIKNQYDEIVETIMKMDEKYSTTLLMILCEEMTVKEISKLMNISEKTVYTRFARGKKILLDSLGGGMTNES